MPEALDHVAEALLCVHRAHERSEPADLMQQALVHATLALVEQQRTANLIALSARSVALDEEMSFLRNEAADRLITRESIPATFFSGPDESYAVRADVRKVLGL